MKGLFKELRDQLCLYSSTLSPESMAWLRNERLIERLDFLIEDSKFPPVDPIKGRAAWLIEGEDE